MSNTLTPAEVKGLGNEVEKRAEDAFRKKHGRNPPARPTVTDGPMSDRELEDQEEMEDLRRGVMTPEEEAQLKATRDALEVEQGEVEARLEDPDTALSTDPRRREEIPEEIDEIDSILDGYGS